MCKTCQARQHASETHLKRAELKLELYRDNIGNHGKESRNYHILMKCIRVMLLWCGFGGCKGLQLP